jgi:hypothetical protein
MARAWGLERRLQSACYVIRGKAPVSLTTPALGPCDLSNHKGERFTTVVTVGLSMWNVGIAFVLGLAVYHAIKRRWIRVSSWNPTHAYRCSGLCAVQTRVTMNIDDILWEELERGPVTIKELTARFERRVRDRRERSRVRGIVIREGRGGAHRQYTYRMQTRGP